MLSRAEGALPSFRCAPPPRPGLYRIVRPAPGETLRLIALGNKIEGTDTHWLGDHSAPCDGVNNGCLTCKVQKPRWYAWLMSYEEATRETVIAEFTAGAVRNCRVLHQGIDLRGRRFDYKRLPEKRQGKCILDIGRHISRYDDLPEAPDLREALARIWGIPLQDAMPEDGGEMSREMSRSELESVILVGRSL